MARDEGIAADAPIIVDHVDVAAADAAVGDGNFDLVGLDVPRIVLVRQEFGTGGMSGKTMKQRHERCPWQWNVVQGVPEGPRKSTLFDFYRDHLHTTEHGLHR